MLTAKNEVVPSQLASENSEKSPFETGECCALNVDEKWIPAIS